MTIDPYHDATPVDWVCSCGQVFETERELQRHEDEDDCLYVPPDEAYSTE